MMLAELVPMNLFPSIPRRIGRNSDHRDEGFACVRGHSF